MSRPVIRILGIEPKRAQRLKQTTATRLPMTDERGCEVDAERGAEMILTDEYERSDGRWLVFTSVGSPLVELSVREDELVSDPG
jgi:hypothetical protein